MRAYLCDPTMKTVTEIDFDASNNTMICELLGQPIENITCFRMNDDPDYDESNDDEREYYCLLYAKEIPNPERAQCWYFGNFDCGCSWDVGIVGRMVLTGSKGAAGGMPLEPHSSTMSLDQAKRYCEFMRDDLISIPMDGAVMLVGEDASDEVRAEAREHNARPEVRETMEMMEKAGFGKMSPKPWQLQ